ncbi:hypothetical protein AJ87_07450 [Rhizobium yanglingense]|nr:hypothetical protein AJ87_07450 [Rhizobium yanglingense]
MMKVFISHQSGDSVLAGQTERAKCTQLLAVVSEKPQQFWWVPWEIGVATEKDFPLASFLGGGAPPPEYLRKWPYLQNDLDINRYAKLDPPTSKRVREAMPSRNSLGRRWGFPAAEPRPPRERRRTAVKTIEFRNDSAHI